MPWLDSDFWPAPCAICKQWARGGLCPPCLQRFASPRPRCPCCGSARSEPAAAADAALPCGQCLREPPPVAGTVAALDYGFPWDRLIGGFKFNDQPELATLLARPLLTALRADARQSACRVDWLLPVPLWPGRAQQRGYNQSWLLARALGRALDKPAMADGLHRWRATDAQSLQTDAAARRANLRGAFWVTPTAQRRLLGRRVALVDDVMTTGATTFEAARCLRQAGAAEVWLWVLARTPA